jgi:D-inositol-3-phosphate glycosyltransferase
MRVALVSEHASPLCTPGGPDAGGQNVHVNALARALAERGLDVTVYTRRTDRVTPPRVVLDSGAVVEHVEAGPARTVPRDELLPHMKAFARELCRAWRARQPDVVHAHFWMSGLAAVQAGNPLTIPVVQTFHALGSVKRRFQHHDPSPRRRVPAEIRLAGAVDAVAATSHSEVEELRSHGAHLRRYEVIPCGVDATLFCPHGPVENRRAQHRLVVVSRLVGRKGVQDVLRALALLPGVELVVAGGEHADDPQIRRLQELARALNIADRVEFRGPVAHHSLPSLIRSADAVVCVPWYEPFGMSALEAMACGVPVVASTVGGLAETVIDGVTGVLVRPQAPAALAEKLGQLLRDEQLRAGIGQQGRARAESRYTWHRVAALTHHLYERVMAAPDTRPSTGHHAPVGGS